MLPSQYQSASVMTLPSFRSALNCIHSFTHPFSHSSSSSPCSSLFCSLFIQRSICAVVSCVYLHPQNFPKSPHHPAACSRAQPSGYGLWSPRHHLSCQRATSASDTCSGCRERRSRVRLSSPAMRRDRTSSSGSSESCPWGRAVIRVSGDGKMVGARLTL